MKEEIQRHIDVGTILDALNVKNIPKLQFVRPPQPVVQQFETQVGPLRRVMEQNQQESRTLAELRDTLLPELISGRIRVPDAEKLVSEVV
jgi:type I restriction enzyme S subunit